ncbi:unnamed protein product, partial [Polarella glacialis]
LELASLSQNSLQPGASSMVLVQGMRLQVQSILGMAMLLSCTRDAAFLLAAASDSPSDTACGAASTGSPPMVQEEVALLQVRAGDQSATTTKLSAGKTTTAATTTTTTITTRRRTTAATATAATTATTATTTATTTTTTATATTSTSIEAVGDNNSNSNSNIINININSHSNSNNINININSNSNNNNININNSNNNTTTATATAEAVGEEYEEESWEDNNHNNHNNDDERAEGPRSRALPYNGDKKDQDPFIGRTSFNKQITTIYQSRSGFPQSNDSWTASRGFYRSHVSKPKHCAEVALRGKVEFPSPTNDYMYQANATYGPFDTGCINVEGNVAPCWNFDFSINSDCEAATSPDQPVVGLTYELCVDNDPTEAVQSICFDPLRSFNFATAFGTVTTGPGEALRAIGGNDTNYPLYVDLMQSQTIAQSSQNPTSGSVWST